MSRLAVVALLFSCLLTAQTAAPVIADGGVVNAADYTATFSPGILFAVFGTNLAAATAQAPGFPLPTTIGGVSVDVLDGSRTLKAPLFFVSAGQVNALLPFEITSETVQIRITTARGQSNTQTIAVTPRSPRLLTKSATGTGEAILVHADFSVVSSDHPALAGEVVILFLTGLGAVSPAVASGQKAGDGTTGNPLNWVKDEVIVKVDGTPATVYFAGLAPGFAGLYQINFQVPENTEPGLPWIQVASAQKTSQEAVAFSSAPRVEKLSSASVPASGGVLTAGGFTLTVPAGAFASTQSLSVARAATGVPAAASRSSEVYALAGLPDVIPAEMTVSLALSRAGGGKAYIVLQELADDGGQAWIAARVEGDRVVATLPPKVGSPPSQMRLAAAKRLRSAEADGAYFFFLYAVLTDENFTWTEYTLQNLHIFYSQNHISPKNVSALAEFLVSDVAPKLATMNLPWPQKSGAQPVTLQLQLNYNVPTRRPHCGGTYRTAAWNGNPDIRISPELLDASQPQPLDRMKAKAAHMLAHFLQNPRPSSTAESRWVWMNEAVATALESYLAPSSWYTPAQISDYRLFPAHGLEYAAVTQDEEALRAHGYGAGAFLRYLFQKYGLERVGKMYKFSRTSYLPVGTLVNDPVVAAAGGANLDISADWKAWVEEKDKPDAVYQEYDGYNLKYGLLKATMAGKFAWQMTLPELSANCVPVILAGKPAADLKLSASVSGGADISAIFVRRGPSGEVLLAKGASVENINVSGYSADEQIWVVVVNKKGKAPFATSTPVTVTLELKGSSGPVLTQAGLDVPFKCNIDTGRCPYRVNIRNYWDYTKDSVQGVSLTWSGTKFTGKGEYVVGSLNYSLDISGELSPNRDMLLNAHFAQTVTSTSGFAKPDTIDLTFQNIPLYPGYNGYFYLPKEPFLKDPKGFVPSATWKLKHDANGPEESGTADFSKVTSDMPVRIEFWTPYNANPW